MVLLYCKQLNKTGMFMFIIMIDDRQVDRKIKQVEALLQQNVRIREDFGR